MARYNTSSTTSTITGTATISSPFQGAFTQFTGSAPYTVTLPAPAAFPGINQTFYNSTGGLVTISTPSGNFTGTGGPSTSTFVLNSGNVVSVVPDGTNYIVLSEDGSPLVATTGSFSSDVSITGGATSITSNSLSISPAGSGSNINNVSIGATTRSTGAFTSLTANQAVTFTANTSSSSTSTGTLVVTGGVGVSGTVTAGALNGPLTGTIQTGVQPNLTQLGSNIYIDTSGRLLVGTNAYTASSSEVFEAYNSGNGFSLFGNNSTSVAPLYVKQSSTSAGFLPWVTFQDTGGNRGGIGQTYSNAEIWLSGQGGFRFLVGGTSPASTLAANIDSSGNLGVGAAADSTAKLYAYSTGQYSTRIVWSRNSGPSSWAGENTLQLKNIYGSGAVTSIGMSVTDTDGDHHRAAIIARSTGGATGALEFYTREGGGGTETSSKIRITSAGKMGLGVGLSAPEGRLHVQEPGITAAAPNLGWPNYVNPDQDASARVVAIFDTSGNGSVATAGYGPTVVVRLGAYYDSRAVISPIGAGGASPSDQGSARGKDLMVKGGQSDNTNGVAGGRLFLNGGAGYSGGFGANGYYGNVEIQRAGGNTVIGKNDAYGAGYNNLYMPFKYNDTGEWAPMKANGWLHIGSFTHRAGNRYLDIKTNNNSGSLMFMFHIYGYLYNSANINTYIGGYSYTGNSILNLYTQNLANCTATAYRTSTNNYLCLKLDRGNNGYSEGKVNVFFHAWSQGEMENLVVTSYAQNDSASNYYTS